MPRSLETRIERLEIDCGGTSLPASRRISVNYNPANDRPLYFHYYGFDVEPLSPALEPPVPRRVPPEPDVLPIVKAYYNEIHQRRQIREMLKGLTRSEQAKLAKRHGYRVLYPGAVRAGAAVVPDS
jgi:hypothetical protein